MNKDDFISHMVQQLSTVAFTRALSGRCDAEVQGRLEKLIRDYFAGDLRRELGDRTVLRGLGQLFVLSYVLPGFIQRVLEPARQLAVLTPAESGGNRGRIRSRPGRMQGVRGGESVSGGRWVRRQWEGRLLALVIREFTRVCRDFLGRVPVEGIPTARLVGQLRARWSAMETGQPAKTLRPGEGKRLGSGIDALCRSLCGDHWEWPSMDSADPGYLERRRSWLEADPGRKDIDPTSCALVDLLQKLSGCGSAPSTPVRRALKWYADWKTCERVVWGAGETHEETVRVEPHELYRAWCEWRLNESMAATGAMEGWEILGRLRGDPHDWFYDQLNQGRPHPIRASELFVPDPRLMLVRADGRSLRRVWVQGEWDEPGDVRNQKGRLALVGIEARNLECEAVVIVTPWMEAWEGTLPARQWKDARAELGLRYLMLPLVPHPDAESVNGDSLGHLFQEVCPP